MGCSLGILWLIQNQILVEFLFLRPKISIIYISTPYIPINSFISCLQAIKEKDWPTFCDLTIADSNEMHAVCQDSFPPCIYMSDTSHAVASLVHQYNETQISKGNLNNKVKSWISIISFDILNPNG